MGKIISRFSILLLSIFLLSCSKELIKQEEFKISNDISVNSSGKSTGFKTLESYTKENYEIVKENTEKEIEKEYEIVKTTNPFTSERDKQEDKNWLKRDWPFGIGLLALIAATLAIF